MPPISDIACDRELKETDLLVLFAAMWRSSVVKCTCFLGAQAAWRLAAFCGAGGYRLISFTVLPLSIDEPLLYSFGMVKLNVWYGKQIVDSLFFMEKSINC